MILLSLSNVNMYRDIFIAYFFILFLQYYKGK